MSVRLARVAVAGNWSALLEELPGWRRDSSGAWQGAGAALRDRCTSRDAGFDIDASFDGRAAPAGPGSFNLNHVAVDLHPGDADLLERYLQAGATTFLERERRYDPSVSAVVDAQHIVCRPTLYLTARFVLENPAGLRLSHIGWEVNDRRDVEHAAAVLRRIGWPIVCGPMVVDGSYLVHFIGPDQHTHDVFHVLGT